MTNTIVMDVPYAGNYHTDRQSSTYRSKSLTFANYSELVVQITFFTVINLFHCDKCGKFLHKLLSANIPLHVVQQRFYLHPWCLVAIQQGVATTMSSQLPCLLRGEKPSFQ